MVVCRKKKIREKETWHRGAKSNWVGGNIKKDLLPSVNGSGPKKKHASQVGEKKGA